MATEKLYDVMVRISAAYGGSGLTAHAISAVDLALWDAKGKCLGVPVYELLGGPQKERIPCYATGFDLEWYRELGFRGIQAAQPVRAGGRHRGHSADRGDGGRGARHPRPGRGAHARLLDGPGR